MKKQLIISFFIFKVISGYADIAPNPIYLKSIMPGENCKVQMVSETVTAKVYKDSSVVECIFTMKNWGREKSIQVGFPVMTFYHWSFNDTYGDDITPFFKVYVGSEQIDKQSLYIPKAAKELQERVKHSERYRASTYQAYRDSLALVYDSKSRDYQEALNRLIQRFQQNDKRYEDVSPGSMHLLLERKNIPFYVWDVKFKAFENITIKVVYKVPSGLKYREPARYFYYILSTGAGWYKRIEKATVRVRIMDFDMNTIRQAKPSNYRIDQASNEYSWDFNNLKPTVEDNVYLEYAIPKNKVGEVK